MIRIATISLLLFLTSIAFFQQCVECHNEVTPNIVTDWQISKHSQNEVTCSVCHGDGHTSANDVEKVAICAQSAKFRIGRNNSVAKAR